MEYKIIEILLTFFLAFLTWLLRQQIKRIDQLEKDSNSIRFNYLDRFTEMSKKLEAIHIDIAVIKNNLTKAQL